MCLDTINSTTKFSPALRRCNPAGVKRDEFASAGGEVEEHPHTHPAPSRQRRPVPPAPRPPPLPPRDGGGSPAGPCTPPAAFSPVLPPLPDPAPLRPGGGFQRGATATRPRILPGHPPPPHVPSPEGRGSVPPRREGEVEEGGGGDDLLGVGGIPIDGV